MTQIIIVAFISCFKCATAVLWLRGIGLLISRVTLKTSRKLSDQILSVLLDIDVNWHYRPVRTFVLSYKDMLLCHISSNHISVILSDILSDIPALYVHVLSICPVNIDMFHIHSCPVIC